MTFGCIPHRILFGSRILRWGNLRKGDHLEDPDVEGRIILNWILREVGLGHGLD
jgi:hypothetical protein